MPHSLRPAANPGATRLPESSDLAGFTRRAAPGRSGLAAAVRPWAFLLAGFSCVAGFTPLVRAAPQPSLKQLSLEDLMQVKVITATQVKSSPFDLPFMTEVFSRADFQERQPRTLPQWLADVPGVMVQKTANGQQSPYLRGFTGFRTLLLIDGIRLNNSTFREGPNQYWTTVDPLAIEQLEIVKGPASVLYGSDAIGGTVNALTAGPAAGQPGDRWHVRSSYRFATAESSHIGRAEFGGPLGPHVSALLGASWKSFGDLRAGPAVGRQARTGYDEFDYDARFDARLRPNLRLTLAHQTVDQDGIWRTHSTTFGSRWLGLVPGSDRQRSTDQQRSLSYARVHATQLPGWATEITACVSQQFQDEDQERIRSDRRRELASVGVRTTGATLQLQSPSPLGHLVYGATFYRDQINSGNLRYRADGSFDRADIQGPVADDSRYDLTGFYLQDQLPRWGAFDFTARGRYDRAAVDAGRLVDPVTNQAGTFRKSWDSLVASGRGTWHPDPRLQVFAGVSQGFRAPNLSDVSRLDSSGSGQFETPSTQVAPEYYVMDELGVKFRTRHLELEAACFYTAIQGMIIREPTGRIVQGAPEVTKRNSGDGEIHGVEAAGRYQVSKCWQLRGGFTWMRGEVTVFPTSNPGSRMQEPVSRLMPATTQLGLRFDATDRAFWGELSGTMAARQARLSSSDLADIERIPRGGTPGYTVITVRGGWRVNEHLSLSASVENLTDRDYRIHGSGINEPGRNLVLSGTARF